MAHRAEDPTDAAQKSIQAVSEISLHLFDDEELHIEEFDLDDAEDDEEEEEAIDFTDVNFAGTALDTLKAKAVRDTMEYVDGDKAAAAEMLQITPQTLGRELKKIQKHV